MLPAYVNMLEMMLLTDMLSVWNIFLLVEEREFFCCNVGQCVESPAALSHIMQSDDGTFSVNTFEKAAIFFLFFKELVQMYIIYCKHIFVYIFSLLF